MSDEIDMEYTIGDAPPLRADEIYAAYDANRAEFVRPDTAHALHARLAELENLFHCAQAAKRQAKRERVGQGLTLATLCDMVLGEDAADRSDDALIRAVGTLKRERDEANKRAPKLQKKIVAFVFCVMCDKHVHEANSLVELGKCPLCERDAAQARSGARMAGVEEWKARAEQAEADARRFIQFIDHDIDCSSNLLGDPCDCGLKEMRAKYLEAKKEGVK